MSISKIQAKKLSKDFVQGGKKLNVLQNIDVEFIQGKTYAITGASGSGKSTLLHLLGGLDTPSAGHVLFDSLSLQKIRGIKKEQFLNKSIGFVFQFHYLINELTVLENIMLMGLIHGQPRKECEKHAKELLGHVVLTDKADCYPFTLSGGEQQRVSILRAIFNKPKFILADEPTGNLDANHAKQVVELLKRYQSEWNTGIILCSHDKAVYGAMENILQLENGKLMNLEA